MMVKINNLFNKKAKEKIALVCKANARLSDKNVEQLRVIKFHTRDRVTLLGT